MNREQLKHLAVSATITFPATFPRLADIQLRQGCDLSPPDGEQATTYLVAIERPSVRVTLKRMLPVSDVRAIFAPRDPNCVHLDDGSWLIGSEIEAGIRLHSANGGRLYGIVYVSEQTPTLLEVVAGMTAAESSQYYPPLPCDRSLNHYDPYRQTRSPLPENLGYDFSDRRPVRGVAAKEPAVCEPQYEFPVGPHFAGRYEREPHACEAHHEFPAPEAPSYMPGYQSFAPKAFGEELTGDQPRQYQNVHGRDAFTPAPFPSEQVSS